MQYAFSSFFFRLRPRRFFGGFAGERLKVTLLDTDEVKIAQEATAGGMLSVLDPKNPEPEIKNMECEKAASKDGFLSLQQLQRKNHEM